MTKVVTMVMMAGSAFASIVPAACAFPKPTASPTLLRQNFNCSLPGWESEERMSWRSTAFAIVMFAVTTARSETWSGIYRQTDGEVIGIGEFHEFGPSEILIDFQRGEQDQ